MEKALTLFISAAQNLFPECWPSIARHIFADCCFPSFNLLCDRQSTTGGLKIAGTSTAAENATVGSEGTIPVWTCHAAVEISYRAFHHKSFSDNNPENSIFFSPQCTVISDQFLYSTAYNISRNTWVKCFRKNIIFIQLFIRNKTCDCFLQ